MRIFSLLFLLTMIFNFNTARAEDLPGGATLTCATAETTFAYDENNQKAWIGFWINQNEMGWRELSEVRFEPGENKLEVYTTLVTEGIGNIYSRHAITFGEKKITMKLSKKDEIDQEFKEMKDKNNKYECTKVESPKVEEPKVEPQKTEEPAKESVKTNADFTGLLTCTDPTDEEDKVGNIEEFYILLDKNFNGIPKKDGSYKDGLMLSIQDSKKKLIDFIGEFKVKNGKLESAEIKDINSRELWKRLLSFPDQLIDLTVNMMMSKDATTDISMSFIYDSPQSKNVTSLKLDVTMLGDYNLDLDDKYEPISPEDSPQLPEVYICTPYVAPKLEPGSKEKKGGEK